MPHDPYKALYIHIPFCVSRCGYCDFETEAVAKGDARITEYAEGIIGELNAKSREGELDELESIYIGGGTPTHIGSKNLCSILYALSLFVDSRGRDIEFTVEANPESLDDHLVNDMWALGVNRLSIGVQSFDDSMLSLLGRAHDSEGARRAIEAARARFSNMSIDLICGIPGQTDEIIEASITEAISKGIPHVSVYALSIEPHTPFYRNVMKGLMPETDDDIQAHQLELASSLLSDAGLLRYEVSNYARPGFESRHNSSYWTGVPYLGIGRGATTMTQNDSRRMRICNGEVVDDLDPKQMVAEDLMLGMRMAKGISDAEVERATELIAETPAVLSTLIEDGLAVHENGRFRPTDLGWLCGNDLYGRLLDLAP